MPLTCNLPPYMPLLQLNNSDRVQYTSFLQLNFHFPQLAPLGELLSLINWMDSGGWSCAGYVTFQH